MDKENKICPVCGHVFQGLGWSGMDGHWRAHHEDIISYEDAWPMIEQGILEDYLVLHYEDD